METTTYYQEITDKIKAKAPSINTIKNIVKENNKVLSVAGGAFLAIIGLKFVSKTVGFLALVSGVAMLYKAGMRSEPVREVLNKIATTDNSDVKG